MVSIDKEHIGIAARNPGGAPLKLAPFARRGADMVRTGQCSIEEAAQTLFDEYRGRRHHSDEATKKQLVRLINAIVEDLRKNPKGNGFRIWRELGKLKTKRAKVPKYKAERKKRHEALMKHIKEILDSIE